MPILAFEIVTAGRLNRMQPVPYSAAASSDLGIGQTAQDIPGASITLTTVADNATYVAIGSFDFDGSGSGSTANAFGRLVVDGVVQAAEALYQVSSASANVRSVITQTWSGTLAAAGSHTLKLQGTTPSGGIEINATHTRLQVIIFEVV